MTAILINLNHIRVSYLSKKHKTLSIGHNLTGIQRLSENDKLSILLLILNKSFQNHETSQILILLPLCLCYTLFGIEINTLVF